MDPIETPVSRRQALQLGAVAAGSLATVVQPGVVLPGSTAQAAENTETLSTAAARSERSFDESWLFHEGDAPGADVASFDDGTWHVLDLPHDWSIQDLPYAPVDGGGQTADPSLLVYLPAVTSLGPSVIGPFDQQNASGGGSTGYTVGGIGWYRKHFSISGLDVNANSSHVELRFDGVYQNADVWLNGVHLGFHPYGYTPFTFDVTPYLNGDGVNVLAVRVDNSGRTSRWYSGSGIYRHTWLTVTGPVRIPTWGVDVTTPEVSEERSQVHVDVSVANLGSVAASAQVRVRVRGPHGQEEVAADHSSPASVPPGGTIAVSVDLPIRNASLWSPDTPHLYTARAEVLVDGRVADSVDTTFGIRSLVWNGTVGFQLNGKAVKVIGGCVHDTHGPLGAVSLDRTAARRVEILKAAGFNAIRTAHNPPTPALLDACDRLGMLVMDEFTDIWDSGKNPQDYSVHFAQWWQQDLTSMILRDRNHPSVVIWSLGNEIPESALYAQRGEQMATTIRALDRTRPITLGGGSTFGNGGDPSWQYVDVGDVHYNANGQGYAGIRAAHPDAAITQSESFPATIFDDWAFVQANDWAVGTWVWAAWDYLGEAGLGKTPVAPEGTWKTIYDQTTQPGWATGRILYRSYGGYGYAYPYFQANCGDLDLIGQRKPQNYWRAAVCGFSTVEILVGRPTPAGTEQEAVWWGYYDEQPSWTWDVAPEQPMTVHVYTSGDSVRLLLNGTDIPTGAVTAPDKGKATFTVPYASGDLTAIVSRRGEVIGRKTLSTAGPAAALRLTSDVEAVTTGRDDLAHVLVEVVDRRGRLVPNSEVGVAFDVSGAGEIAGTANGNPHNVDSFRQPHRYTWHGQALVILRPAKSPGVIWLTARADGLEPARLLLPVGLDDR